MANTPERTEPAAPAPSAPAQPTLDVRQVLNLPDNPFAALVDMVTTDDEERVEAARTQVDRIFSSQEAFEWAQANDVEGDTQARGPTALRNENTRDAALYGLIQNFYGADNNAEAILERFTTAGFHDERSHTNRTYLINMGPSSIGRGPSNQEAVLVVDESQSPPIITLAFRGSNPEGTPGDWQRGLFGGNNPLHGLWDMAVYFFTGHTGSTPIPEWLVHFKAFSDILAGRPVQPYQQQTDLFWQSAGPEVTRIMREVAARHGGQAPEIILTGHSYGVDAATRMVPIMAEAFPQWRENIDLVGFGGMPSFTRAEQTRIMGMLGGTPEEQRRRARQYMNENDWIDPVGRVAEMVPFINIRGLSPFNAVVGDRRTLVGASGHEYALPTAMLAMGETIEQELERDPRRAGAMARALQQAYERDEDGFLTRLQRYASLPETQRGDLLATLVPNLSDRHVALAASSG